MFHWSAGMPADTTVCVLIGQLTTGSLKPRQVNNQMGTSRNFFQRYIQEHPPMEHPGSHPVAGFSLEHSSLTGTFDAHAMPVLEAVRYWKVFQWPSKTMTAVKPQPTSSLEGLPIHFQFAWKVFSFTSNLLPIQAIWCQSRAIWCQLRRKPFQNNCQIFKLF